jgi:hypothetical protein
MKLSTPDILRIIALIVGCAGLLTGPVLESFGLQQNTATHVAAVCGFIVSFGALVPKIISTPSPQAGSNFAMIPQGSIPIVGKPTAGGAQVGVIDPAHAKVQPLQQKVG